MAGIARQNCANFGSEGICTGVRRCTDGSQVRFLPEGARCPLLDGKRCGYFEAYVMPMALESWEWKNLSEGKRFRDAVDQYRRIHGESKAWQDGRANVQTAESLSGRARDTARSALPTAKKPLFGMRCAKAD